LQIAGDALFQSGKLPEALRQYEALIAVVPESSSGYFRKGEVSRATQEFSEAETQYRLALERAPGSPEVLTRLVGLLLQKKTPDVAIRLIEEQLEQSGHKAPLHQLLGHVYLTINEPTRAEEHLQRAIAVDKNLLAAYTALGELYTRQRHPDKVIAQYQAMAAAAPTLPAPHMLLGTTYESQGREEDAMGEYERALQLDPRFAPAANNLAWLYSQRGKNLDVALDLAQTAMERLPDDPHVSDTLGWIYYQKGAYLKAVSLLQDSARRLPDHAVVKYHLGMAYAKHGNIPAATRELNAALGLDPSFSGAQEAKQTLAALKTPG
ncbi:MAG: tetratricopeptide repeat protein, partial [Nitrospiria bacterium]